MRDDYYAEFAQTVSNDGSINRKLKTDWMINERVAFGWGGGGGGDDDSGGGGGGGGADAANQGTGKASPGSAKAEQELSIEIEHRSWQENFTRSETNVSLTQTTGAVDDDVVWTKIQTTDFWRFPASGGRLKSNAGSPTALAGNAYLEVAVPADPVISIGPGSASEAYQPTHQIGNILSYPAINGSTQDIGELSNSSGATHRKSRMAVMSAARSRMATSAVASPRSTASCNSRRASWPARTSWLASSSA